jgi:hypothetical protein
MQVKGREVPDSGKAANREGASKAEAATAGPGLPSI